MSKHIGKVIRIVVLVLAILLTIVFIAVGAVLMSKVGGLIKDMGFDELPQMIGLDIGLSTIVNLVVAVLMVLNVFITWLVFIFLYGYGTLIQESIEMRKMMEQMYNAPLMQQPNPGPEYFAQLQNDGTPTTF